MGCSSKGRRVFFAFDRKRTQNRNRLGENCSQRKRSLFKSQCYDRYGEKSIVVVSDADSANSTQDMAKNGRIARKICALQPGKTDRRERLRKNEPKLPPPKRTRFAAAAHANCPVRPKNQTAIRFRAAIDSPDSDPANTEELWLKQIKRRKEGGECSRGFM